MTGSPSHPILTETVLGINQIEGEIAAKKKCRSCGKEIPAEAKVCEHCQEDVGKEVHHKGWQISFGGSLDVDGKWDDRADLVFPYGGAPYITSRVGEDLFDTATEARASAFDIAQRWIEQDGRIPLSKVDPRFFPFQFRIGDQVRSKIDNSAVGIIREGFFKGETPGPYKVTYRVEKDEDSVFVADQKDLEKID